jgi:hypothetical protein
MHAVLEARGAGGTQIVHVPTDRTANVRRHRAIFDAVDAAQP